VVFAITSGFNRRRASLAAVGPGNLDRITLTGKNIKPCMSGALACPRVEAAKANLGEVSIGGCPCTGAAPCGEQGPEGPPSPTLQPSCSASNAEETVAWGRATKTPWT